MTDWASGPAAGLPIVEAIDPLRAALSDRRRAVLHAPPGAGKTTIVPLVLAAEPWCDGSVVMLEPRRLAVRNAARRLAHLAGDRPGGTVGWRMRGDTRVSPRTRIEVVTEGVLTRRLQHDPSLDGVAAVVFDEFHERSLDTDLGLAFTLEAIDALRPDLRLVVMSATFDVEPVAELLDAPVVSSPGRLHPVEVIQVDTDRRAPIDVAVVPVVERAVRTHPGDVLVFLPGRAEIDRVRRRLGPLRPEIDVRPLHGSLPPADQDRAIAPAPDGRRKLVLSTAIAETSVTIEGVTVVVDAGWRRTPRLDPGSGMSRLVTLPVTRAEAEQRAGRAGRLAPGTVYRCWSRSEHATLRSHPEPEIEVADLTSLALELAAWGAGGEELAWLTRPPDAHLAAARSLLADLGALEGVSGRITDHGRALADLPLHPRLAQMVVRGTELGHGRLATEVAAVLAEHRLARRGDTHLADRVGQLSRSDGTGPSSADRSSASDRSSPTERAGSERGVVERARAEVARLRAAIGIDHGGRPVDRDALGLLVALGFPDRVGRARSGAPGEFLLANGRGAFVDPTDPLASSDLVAVAELDGQATRSRIFAAAPLDHDDLRVALGHRIVTESEVAWRNGDVVAREVERLGAVILVDRPLREAPTDQVEAALLDGLRTEGIGLLPWNGTARRLQARLGFLHRLDPARWPAIDDATLTAEAGVRIGPHLTGCRRRRDLARVDPAEVLLHGLGWDQRRDVDRLAPERLPVASGHHHRVDYGSDPPVLAVKLQELFGATDTPMVGGGRVPVVLHLLSPAGRPVQITQDLASFWAEGYHQVRADLRGRYPRHPWPEDPATANATAATKRRR
jgi:ATP-dependent helicase HrpB